jgi:hypothetical protein
MCSYSLDHLRVLIRAGSIKAQKFGRTWQVDRNSVIEHLQKLSTAGERRGAKPKRALLTDAV